MPEAMLAIRGVSVTYGKDGAQVRALHQVSLNFTPGDLTVVSGPSGSGKTTLLSVLGCLLRPDAGHVAVNGQETSSLSEAARTEVRRRNIGFIFQAFRLFHSLPAIENVMLSAGVAGKRDRQSLHAARRLLESLGLGDKLSLRPNALSGGEQQRVAIARALLTDPRILLADEPTASLDSRAGRAICEILRDLAREQRRIVVVVSHDPRWTEFATRTINLEDGQVIQDRRQAA